MRLARILFGTLLLAFGLTLLATLLYDASEVAALVRRNPAPSEGLVALVGLGVAAVALAAGGRVLRRSLSAPAAAAFD